MARIYSTEEQKEIIALAREAFEIKEQYCDKLSELETAIGFDVDGWDCLLDAAPGEDCSPAEFQLFIDECLESSEEQEGV